MSVVPRQAHLNSAAVVLCATLLLVSRAHADFIRGDVNGDTLADLTDARGLLICQFVGTGCPACFDSMDTNDDGLADVTDALQLLIYLFVGGVTIPAPNQCGGDPTEDALPCDEGAFCTDHVPFTGLWTSTAELAGRSTSVQDPAWKAVWDAARIARAEAASIWDHNSNNNVQILAAAIVFARNGDSVFRQRVIAAIEKLVAVGNPRNLFPDDDGCPEDDPVDSGGLNRTLAWGRELGAYVLAADLVDYRTDELSEWLTNMTDVWEGCEGRTMRRSFFDRPNNWGLMNFGSLVAVDAYFGDVESLNAMRDHFIRGLQGPAPTPPECKQAECFQYGRDDTWHCDGADPRLINPPCVVTCDDGSTVDFGGLIPDDQRRSGSFFMTSCDSPTADAHISDWITGAVMAARILERVGLEIWTAGDFALKRMIEAHVFTHPQLFENDKGFQCEGPYNCKSWVMPILEQAYGISLPSAGIGASKNAGYGAYIVKDE